MLGQGIRPTSHQLRSAISCQNDPPQATVRQPGVLSLYRNAVGRKGNTLASVRANAQWNPDRQDQILGSQYFLSGQDSENSSRFG